MFVSETNTPPTAPALRFGASVQVSPGRLDATGKKSCKEKKVRMSNYLQALRSVLSSSRQAGFEPAAEDDMVAPVASALGLGAYWEYWGPCVWRTGL